MTEFGAFGETLKNLEDPLALLQGVFAHAPVGFEVFAPDGTLLIANPAAFEIFGGMPPSGYNILQDPQNLRMGIMPLLQSAFRGEIVKMPVIWYDSSETPGRESTGRRSAITATFFPVRGSGNELRYVAVLIRDLTAELEAHAREIENRFLIQGVQNLGKIGVWTAEFAQKRPREWSRQMFEIFGFEYRDTPPTIEEFMSRVYPEDRNRVTAFIEEMFQKPIPVELEFRVVRVGMKPRWVRVRREVNPDESGNPKHVLGFVQDVTEAKERDERLRVTEERFKLLFESDLMGVFIVDKQGNVREANDRFLAMIGYAPEDVESRALSWQKLTPPGYEAADLRAIEQVRTRGLCTPYQKEYLRKDGSVVPILLGAAVVKASGNEVIAFALDLSEIKRLEQHVRQVQKMDAIGRFAGGVAHDFNNFLSVILLQAEEAIADLAGSGPTQKLRAIKDSAERAARLTRRILAFSRERAFEGELVDLNGVVRDFTTMLRSVLGEDVELMIEYAPEPAMVRVDLAQIEQTLLNLTFNARDAMPDGGSLRIQVDGKVLGEAEITKRKLTLAPGRYCRLIVSDSGQGMDAATLSHVFEPFFTTKEPGKGTGLGLPTVYGIVRQSGGDISIESAVGEGTRVALYFPCVSDLPASASGRTGLRDGVDAGGRTILLVEDEDALRTVTSTILRKAGYRVIEAASGPKALEALEAAGTPIDLILTDVIMPGLTGPALVQELRARRLGGAARVLYMSGYSAGELARQGMDRAGGVFVEKPFTARSLLEKVGEVLSGARVADPNGHEPEPEDH